VVNVWRGRTSTNVVDSQRCRPTLKSSTAPLMVRLVAVAPGRTVLADQGLNYLPTVSTRLRRVRVVSANPNALGAFPALPLGEPP